MMQSCSFSPWTLYLNMGESTRSKVFTGAFTTEVWINRLFPLCGQQCVWIGWLDGILFGQNSEIPDRSVKMQWGMLISFNCFGVNWIHTKCTQGGNKDTSTKSGMVLQVEAADIFSILFSGSWWKCEMIPGSHKARTGSVSPIGMVCQCKLLLQPMFYHLMQGPNSMVVIPDDRQAVSLWKLGRSGRLTIGRVRVISTWPSFGAQSCMAPMCWVCRMFLNMKGLIPLTISHSWLAHPIEPPRPFGSSPSELKSYTSESLQTLWCSGRDPTANTPYWQYVTTILSIHTIHTNYLRLVFLQSSPKILSVSTSVFEFSHWSAQWGVLSLNTLSNPYQYRYRTWVYSHRGLCVFKVCVYINLPQHLVISIIEYICITNYT